MPRLITKIISPFLLAVIVTIISCNKVPLADTSLVAPVTTNTVADIINSTASYSILKAAVAKAGLLPLLSRPGATLTVFAPDDNAFMASGISAAAIGVLDAATLKSLLSYHVIPQTIPSTNIPMTFPNQSMPTFLTLLPPFVSNPIFLSKRGANAWANNVPIVQADIPVSNGVMHRVAAVVNPPSMFLKQIIAADTAFTFLRAAITRADSGQVGLSRFDSAMNYAVANLTIFAPTNNAFRTTLGIPDSSVFRALPVLTVRGIIGYHILGTRAFSVNLPTTTMGLPTLIGPAPVLTIDWSTGSLRLKGAGNGTALYSITTADRNAINGVVHKIDGVLRPQ
ncbi:MAG: fasciclin domain-containing protein [Chitinophagaceae bacterium]